MELNEVNERAVKTMGLKRFRVSAIQLSQHAITKELRLYVEFIPSDKQAKKLKEDALEFLSQ